MARGTKLFFRMADRATFLVQYPEFGGMPVAQLDAILAEAVASTSSTAYQTSDLFDYAVYRKVAIIALEHPAALKLRQDMGDKGLQRWRRLLHSQQRAATMGLRVF